MAKTLDVRFVWLWDFCSLFSDTWISGPSYRLGYYLYSSDVFFCHDYRFCRIKMFVHLFLNIPKPVHFEIHFHPFSSLPYNSHTQTFICLRGPNLQFAMHQHFIPVSQGCTFAPVIATNHILRFIWF